MKKLMLAFGVVHAITALLFAAGGVCLIVIGAQIGWEAMAAGNDGISAAQDVIEAIGILLCPLLQSRMEVADGSLVRVLPEWMPPPRHVYAVWTQRRYLPARVRVLLEHLAEFAAASPLLQE